MTGQPIYILWRQLDIKIICKLRRLVCDSFCKVQTRWLLVLFITKFRTYLFLGLLPLPDLLSNILACPLFSSHFRGSDHSCSLAVLFIIKIKYPFATFIMPIMHLVCPLKFGISLGFNLSWNDCNTQEKLGKSGYTKQSANKVYYGQYKSCE